MIAAVAIAGCQSPGGHVLEDADSVARLGADVYPGASDKQILVVEDNRVAHADIRELFGDFAACMNAAGLHVSDAQFDPVSGVWLDYSYWPNSLDPATPLSEEQQSSVLECETRHIFYAQDVFARTEPWRMDEDLKALMLACAKRKGIPVSLEEFESDLQSVPLLVAERGGDIGALNYCLDESFFRLFPEGVLFSPW